MADPGWGVVATGDFNDDNWEDIVLQHDTTGVVVVWQLSGTTLASTVYLGPGTPSSAGDRIAGVGDFNQDALPDVVWQNPATGTLSVWYMDGTSLESTEPLDQSPIADTTWEIVGVEDFDGDGDPDLLWQKRGGPSSGYLVIWVLDGTGYVWSRFLWPAYVLNLDWTVVGMVPRRSAPGSVAAGRLTPSPASGMATCGRGATTAMANSAMGPTTPIRNPTGWEWTPHGSTERRPSPPENGILWPSGTTRRSGPGAPTAMGKSVTARGIRGSPTCKSRSTAAGF